MTVQDNDLCSYCGCLIGDEPHADGCQNLPPRPARFFIWDGDEMVCLTLQVGELREFNRGGATDEGYSYHYESYYNTGEQVEREVSSQASDCDGRFDTSSECVCAIEDLRSVFNEHTGVMMPDWKERDASQRDYSAEAMGY